MTDKKLFISHAAKDKPLVDRFVDLLDVGCRLPREEIFCTSADDLGVPAGNSNFIDYIKSTIKDPSLVILILSPNYFSSPFCMCELGAVWALSLPNFPLIVPPITQADVGGVLEVMQCKSLDSKPDLDSLRDTIIEKHAIEKSPTATWSTKCEQFISDLPEILRDIPSPEIKKFGTVQSVTSGLKTPNIEYLSSIELKGKMNPLPCFFPSISSVKSMWRPIHYLRVLDSYNHPQFLLSGYDLFHLTNDNDAEENNDEKETKDIIDKIHNERIILIDSGYYESSVTKDPKWDQTSYWQALKSFDNYDLLFTFDKADKDREKEISQELTKEKQIQARANMVEGTYLRDLANSRGRLIPIVHGNKDNLPEIVANVATRLNPIVMVAVPERDLGNSVMDCARTLLKIRLNLIKNGKNVPIHLLGTGNPLSILIYSICGANSFDGLDWCQAAIDITTGIPYHLKQGELIAQHSQGLEYNMAVLQSNLTLFTDWMRDINQALLTGNIQHLAKRYLSQTAVERLNCVLSEYKN